MPPFSRGPSTATSSRGDPRGIMDVSGVNPRSQLALLKAIKARLQPLYASGALSKTAFSTIAKNTFHELTAPANHHRAMARNGRGWDVPYMQALLRLQLGSVMSVKDVVAGVGGGHEFASYLDALWRGIPDSPLTSDPPPPSAQQLLEPPADEEDERRGGGHRAASVVDVPQEELPLTASAALQSHRRSSPTRQLRYPSSLSPSARGGAQPSSYPPRPPPTAYPSHPRHEAAVGDGTIFGQAADVRLGGSLDELRDVLRTEKVLKGMEHAADELQRAVQVLRKNSLLRAPSPMGVSWRRQPPHVANDDLQPNGERRNSSPPTSWRQPASTPEAGPPMMLPSKATRLEQVQQRQTFLLDELQGRHAITSDESAGFLAIRGAWVLEFGAVVAGTPDGAALVLSSWLPPQRQLLPAASTSPPPLPTPLHDHRHLSSETKNPSAISFGLVDTPIHSAVAALLPPPSVPVTRSPSPEEGLVVLPPDPPSHGSRSSSLECEVEIVQVVEDDDDDEVGALSSTSTSNVVPPPPPVPPSPRSLRAPAAPRRVDPYQLPSFFERGPHATTPQQPGDPQASARRVVTEKRRPATNTSSNEKLDSPPTSSPRARFQPPPEPPALADVVEYIRTLLQPLYNSGSLPQDDFAAVVRTVAGRLAKAHPRLLRGGTPLRSPTRTKAAASVATSSPTSGVTSWRLVVEGEVDLAWRELRRGEARKRSSSASATWRK